MALRRRQFNWKLWLKRSGFPVVGVIGFLLAPAPMRDCIRQCSQVAAALVEVSTSGCPEGQRTVKNRDGCWIPIKHTPPCPSWSVLDQGECLVVGSPRQQFPNTIGVRDVKFTGDR